MSSEQDERESGSKTSGAADTMRDNTKVDIRSAGKDDGEKKEVPDQQRDAT
jgi:hypothetical protein